MHVKHTFRFPDEIINAVRDAIYNKLNKTKDLPHGPHENFGSQLNVDSFADENAKSKVDDDDIFSDVGPYNPDDYMTEVNREVCENVQELKEKEKELVQLGLKRIM